MTDHSRLQHDVLSFWFGDDPSELRPKWFKQSAEFDRQCARFADAIHDGRAGQFDHWADFAHSHRDVIRRFGRFPNRNAALGRPNTPEEVFIAHADLGF